MALAVKVIGFGQLTGTSGTDLSSAVSTGKAQIVKSMRFTNVSTSASASLNASLKHSGTERQIVPKNLTLAPGGTYVDDSEISLEAGDNLRGSLTASGTVDYVISGVERDA